MTDQEAFDKVVAHLLEQKVYSVDSAAISNLTGCYMPAYRGDNATKCAIGCLIPDDQYSPEMEGKRVYRVICNFPDLPFAKVNFQLLSELQYIHDAGSGFQDNHMNLPSIKNRLKICAFKFNLVEPESLNTPPIATPAT